MRQVCGASNGNLILLPLIDAGSAHDWDHAVISSGTEGITAVKVFSYEN